MGRNVLHLLPAANEKLLQKTKYSIFLAFKFRTLRIFKYVGWPDTEGLAVQGNILVVDDDRDFAEGLAELLDLEGYGTELAFNRSEAIARNERSPPDIAILDIRLGKEDGLSLVKALRAENPDLQCVMLTGFAALNTAVDAVRLGAQDYLTKPVEREHLRAVLERCMRMRALIEAEASAREALQQSEERYRQLTELSPVGVFQTDENGGYSLVNPRWCELSGMSEVEALGTGWQNALHVGDRARVVEDWDLCVRDRRRFSAEFRLQAGGATRWVLGEAMPQRVGGDGGAYIGTITDITAHKELERQAAAARRAESLESTAGGIAHHMNNALQIVAGYLHLAREQAEPGAAVREFLDLASSGISRLSTITKNLLHFTGSTVLDVADINPNALLSDIYSQFVYNSSAPVFIDLSLSPDLWATRSQATQLRIAFDAIIQNALDAMNEAGTIRIASANRRLDSPPAGLAPGDYVEIVISDTGPGMSEEIAERAEEPFFTTKGPQSTGLGLSIAQGIIRKSRGAMKLDSAPGEGTTVTVHLPRAER